MSKGEVVPGSHGAVDSGYNDEKRVAVVGPEPRANQGEVPWLHAIKFNGRRKTAVVPLSACCMQARR